MPKAIVLKAMVVGMSSYGTTKKRGRALPITNGGIMRLAYAM